MKGTNVSAELENQIASEMVHVSRQMIRKGAQAMESLSIGMGQLPILKLLSDNGTMTQRRISEEIRVTPATICGTIKRMERSGLVKRSTAEADGRVSCVSLTADGAERCARAFEVIGDSYATMLGGFSDDECRQLLGFIRRMGENLTQSMEDADENW